MKVVTEFHENLSRIIPVKAAEGQTIVEQQVAIRNVESRYRDRNMPPRNLSLGRDRRWYVAASGTGRQRRSILIRNKH